MKRIRTIYKIFFFFVTITVGISVGYAQVPPQTNSSSNAGTRGAGYYPHSGYTPTPGGCFREEKAWEAGHWEFDGAGRRFWVQGAWLVRQIAVPCVEPTTVPGGCLSPSLPPGAFQQALASIACRTFEASKLGVAQQIVTSNCLSASQVRDVMGLFTYESSRLQIAKLAYPYVCDPNMYFIVNDVFTFTASVRELSDYINAIGRPNR